MKKITVITGASSGMGKEFAVQLFNRYEKQNEQNRELWLLARSKENLEELATTLTSKTKVKIFAVDLSGSAGAQKFNQILQDENSTEELFIEYLINNAGFGTYGPFNETPVEKEMQMIDLNCTSLTGICGYSIKYLKEGSTIINVASLASFMPLGNFAVYAATKAYVLSFSLALAAELKDKKIKVCALCPGSVSTNFANIASNGKRKEVLHGRDPKKVVSHCLKNADKGKKIILTFAKWRLTAFASRFAGRFLVARATFIFAKRPH